MYLFVLYQDFGFIAASGNCRQLRFPIPVIKSEHHLLSVQPKAKSASVGRSSKSVDISNTSRDAAAIAAASAPVVKIITSRQGVCVPPPGPLAQTITDTEQIDPNGSFLKDMISKLESGAVGKPSSV